MRSIEHKNQLPEDVVDGNREVFHKRLGHVMRATGEFALDATIGTLAFGAYSVARGIHGIVHIGKNVGRGAKGKSFDQSA